MGIVTKTVGSQQYLAMCSDLEFKINQVNEAKLSLTKSLNELVSIGTDMDPESVEAKQLQERKAKLHQFEKLLDMKLQEYQVQLSLAQSNMQALK